MWANQQSSDFYKHFLLLKATKKKKTKKLGEEVLQIINNLVNDLFKWRRVLFVLPNKKQQQQRSDRKGREGEQEKTVNFVATKKRSGKEENGKKDCDCGALDIDI